MIQGLRYILLAIAMIAVQLVAAQTYSTDPQKFIDEYSRGLAATNQPNAKEHSEAFKTLWSSSTLSDAQKTKMIDVINQMRKKRIVPLQVMLFTQTIIHVTQGQRLITVNVDEYINISEKVTQNEAGSAGILRYLTNTEALIRTGTLYKNASAGWYADIQNPKLEYKEGDTSATATNLIPAGAYLNFNANRLTYSNKRDSIMVYEVAGKLNLATQQFYGAKGKVTWERHGAAWKNVYVDLGDFKASLKESFLQDDSVMFYYPDYLPKAAKGEFKDVPAGVFGRAAQYPIFRSHDIDIELKGLADNIQYKGGFTLKGTTKIGSGDRGIDAVMTIKKSSSNYVKIGTQSVLLDSSVYVARPASVTIVSGKDSLFHPALDFKYNAKIKYLTFLRNNSRGSDNRNRVPLYDSYHKLEFEFDIIEWYLDSTVIRFNNVLSRANNKGIIRSADYFNRDEFMKLQSIFPINIVAWLVKYHKENPDVPLIVEDVTDELNGGKNASKKSNTKTGLGVQLMQVEAALMEAEAKGYIRFNRVSREIILLPKSDEAILALNKFFNAYNAKREQNEKGYKAPPKKEDKDYDQIMMFSAMDKASVEDTTKHLQLLPKIREYQSYLKEEQELYKREVGTKKFENERKRQLEAKQNEQKTIQEALAKAKSETVKKNYEKDLALLQKEIEDLQNPSPPDSSITVKKFSRFAVIPESEIHTLVNKLTYDSLVTYDSNTDIIELTKTGNKRLDSTVTADTTSKSVEEKIKERNKKRLSNAELSGLVGD